MEYWIGCHMWPPSVVYSRFVGVVAQPLLASTLGVGTPRQQSTGNRWLAQEITQNELKISNHHQVVWLYRYFVDAELFPFWGLIKYIA